MTSSDHMSATAWWFLLSCVLIVSTTTVFRVGSSIGWRPVVAALSYASAALIAVCLAVVAVWWVRMRVVGKPIAFDGRLERIRAPRHAPRRDPGLAVHAPAGAVGLSPLCGPAVDQTGDVPSSAAPSFLPESDGHAPDTVEDRVGADREPRGGIVRDPGARQSLESQFRVPLPEKGVPAQGEGRSTERSPLASEAQSNRDNRGHEGGDAQRLAEVLNLYERLGYLPDDGSRELGAIGDAGDSVPTQNGLWNELVDVHNAESIDLRDAGSGGCVITLDSGNMVFYDPDSGRWVWVVFDRAETARDLIAHTTPVRSVDVADG